MGRRDNCEQRPSLHDSSEATRTIDSNNPEQKSTWATDERGEIDGAIDVQNVNRRVHTKTHECEGCEW